MTKETVTLLIDTDIVAFKVAAVNQQKHDWGAGLVTQSTSLEAAKVQAVNVIEGLIKQLKADKAIVCLTDSENWRYSVLPSYKSNRVGVERPVLLKEVKDHLASKYETFTRPTLEADDVMGILSTHPKLIKGKKIIVSEDKDMKTIPGWLFNPAKDTKPRKVTLEEADTFHLYQTIIGDTTDGYKGCPGAGPKAANALLEEYTDSASRWKAIVRLYESKGLTEEDALVQARVASICRFTNYDFTKKEVILWNNR